jgi:hypothetical protein
MGNAWLAAWFGAYRCTASIKKAPGVPGLKGDQLRSLAAARRADPIPRHKSGKARIAAGTAIAPRPPGVGETGGQDVAMTPPGGPS